MFSRTPLPGLCAWLAAWGLGTAFAAVNPAPPALNTNNVIVVTNIAYGASVTNADNASAIQKAINAAAKGGQTNGLYGGTVEIPAPGTYLCGPLNLSNYVNLQIDAGAVLRMLPYTQYPGGIVNPPNFISGSKLHDIEICGPGAIDGQGAPWWPGYKTNNRPIMISLSGCNRELIQNITLSNSPMFHIAIGGSAGNSTVQGVIVRAPSSSDPLTPSHNTDACDVSGTNILVQNCNISTGDDDFTCGGGTHDVLLTNNVYGNGHGVSIGSYTDSGGVSNITVINCTFNGTDNGLRIKSDDGRGGLVQNISYCNLGMTNVHFPIQLYAYYLLVGTPSSISPNYAATQAVAAVTGTTPAYRNITYSNIIATSVSGYPVGIVWARTEMPATNIVFNKVKLTGDRNFCLYNVSGAQFIDCDISTSASSNSFALFDAQVVITNSAPTNNLFTFGGLTTNGYGNSLKLYDALGSLKDTNLFDDGPLTLSASTFAISNNLTLFPSTVVNYTLGTYVTQLTVSSNLTLGGTINVAAGPGFGPGTKTLLTYGRNLSGNLPMLGSAPAGYFYAFDTNTAGQVNLSVQASNTPPLLAPVADRTVNAGVTLTFTNIASDTDSPPQVLTFSLLTGPANATLNATDGVFSWRPLVAQANSTNQFKLKVADNGSPSLSATQSFIATVNPLARPALSGTAPSGGQFSLSVSGAAGPDYMLQAATDLVTPNWTTIFTTNSPVPPFNWIEPGSVTNPVRFYRVLLGP